MRDKFTSGTTHFSEPLVKLSRNEGDVSETLREMSPVLEEVGRIIYSNQSVTINLAWAAAGVIGLGLCEYSVAGLHQGNTGRKITEN